MISLSQPDNVRKNKMIGTKKSGFPQTFADLKTEFLIEIYQAGANRLRNATEDLTSTDLRSRPLPEKWTMQEILAHLLDSEIMATLRFRFTIAQSGSNFIVYNQDVWAIQHDYQKLSREEIDQTLTTFANLREMNLRLFRQANDEDWQKHGVHPELGTATLRNLLELYADHSERHLGQLLTLRKLIGKPLEMPLLLTERLY